MKNFPRWARWLTGLLLFFAVVIFMPTGSRARPNARRSACQSNLRQIALACQQYMRDSDNYFPPISRSSRLGEKGWADLLYPYTGNTENWTIYQCPEGQEAVNKQSSDYFYNARLVHRSKLRFPAQIILFGDGYDNGGTNSHLELSLAVSGSTAYKEDNSPAWRHLDGANYAFADGHVKWLKPLVPSSEKARGSNSIFTFNPN